MGLEQAHAALDQALSQQSSGESAPDTSQSQAPDSSSQPSVTELEKLERFKFDGKEWTPGDLKSAYMMQSDYTRKTTELAQERRYVDNLQVDLDSVRANPALAQEFKKMYPEKYHKFLDYIQTNNPQAQAPVVESQKPRIDPEYANRLEKIEKHFEQQETRALESEVNTAFDEFSKKYPMADQRVVTAAAQLALQSGTPLRDADGKLNKEPLEQIFKSEHQRIEAQFNSHYKSQFENQKLASSKARDVASGGGVPGQSPKKMTLREASAAAIASAEGRN